MSNVYIKKSAVHKINNNQSLCGHNFNASLNNCGVIKVAKGQISCILQVHEQTICYFA